jgi:hypothetical protein
MGNNTRSTTESLRQPTRLMYLIRQILGLDTTHLCFYLYQAIVFTMLTTIAASTPAYLAELLPTFTHRTIWLFFELSWPIKLHAEALERRKIDSLLPTRPKQERFPLSLHAQLFVRSPVLGSNALIPRVN